jgi:hypothetical protein
MKTRFVFKAQHVIDAATKAYKAGKALWAKIC